MENNIANINEINNIIKDPRVRSTVAKSSHEWFFSLYLSHYVTYPTAPFQKEMFLLSEREDVRLAVICAFRGSGKSTILNLSYPIWAVLGKLQKKHILIVGQTQPQARQHLDNIKRELEANTILRADLGPFEERDEDWSAGTIVLPKYNARITAVSMDQSIRGIRHGQYRPDLIICDDIEDSSSVKTRESRNKTFDWLTSEVFPVGDKNTKIVVVGNLLHEDSLIVRLKERIESGAMDGVFRSYPLLRDSGECNWPGKYPNEDEISRLKSSIGSNISWHREYLLHIISDQERVIHPEWIQFYDELPENPLYSATSIDLAISTKTSADFTAMVSAVITGSEENMKIYILPNPINARLEFPEAVALIGEITKNLQNSFHFGYSWSNQYVWFEEVAYQAAFGQQVRYEDIPADIEGFNPGTQDKRTRLALTSVMVNSGKVLFPRRGCERLIEQIIGFGVEKHDDLADSFSMLVIKAMEKNKPLPNVFFA
ncbi:MAG: hypothetical protein WC805_01300 [Patescibacteria group bacterium]|jgi:phage terminase large subunit-like protein